MKYALYSSETKGSIKYVHDLNILNSWGFKLKVILYQVLAWNTVIKYPATMLIPWVFILYQNKKKQGRSLLKLCKLRSQSEIHDMSIWKRTWTENLGWSRSRGAFLTKKDLVQRYFCWGGPRVRAQSPSCRWRGPSKRWSAELKLVLESTWYLGRASSWYCKSMESLLLSSSPAVLIFSAFLDSNCPQCVAQQIQVLSSPGNARPATNFRSRIHRNRSQHII